MPEDELTPDSDYDVAARLTAEDALFGEDGDSVGLGWFRNRFVTAINHAKTVLPDTTPPVHRWIRRGPRNVGGRIRSIVQDTKTPQRFYAGSAFGGLWKTENSGDTWHSLDVSFAPGANAATHVEAAFPIGAIALCHHKPAVLYVGTGEPIFFQFSGTGLYRSIDGGAHFLLVAGTAGIERFEKIVVDPWNENRAWIATATGLLQCRNAAPGVAALEPLAGTQMPPMAHQQDITDVAIDFGHRARTGPLPAGYLYTVYIALRARRKNYTVGHSAFGELHYGGIYRASFDPHTETYKTPWERLHDPAFPIPVLKNDPRLPKMAEERAVNSALQMVQRIKLSICENNPGTLYMVAGLKDHKASNVFRSDNRGDTWTMTAVRPDDSGKQAYYDLLIAAHPDDPNICITGSVELWRTLNGGEGWERILESDRFRKGDRAQHADQHLVIYDNRDPRRIWLANDHGISESKTLGKVWRTRSFGIQATQLYDLTSHPTYPWIMAGGFQDNGSWISFGGTSWLVCGIADGGAIGFQPGATDVFLASTQGSVMRSRVQFSHDESLRPDNLGDYQDGGLWHARNGNRLADQPAIKVGDKIRYPIAVIENRTFDTPFNRARPTIFGHKIAAHTVRPNSFIAGETGSAWTSTGGTLGTDPVSLTWEQIDDSVVPDTVSFPDFDTTAIAYAPTLPAIAPSVATDNNQWIGTSSGQVFFTPDGGIRWIEVTARIQLATALAANLVISDIAVHPRNTNIVAITLGRSANNVLISSNARRTNVAGASTSTWHLISHEVGTPVNQRLPACPVTRVVIDGDLALGSNAGSVLTVFVATLVGVFVSRNIIANGTGNVVWATFNADLPLVLLRDLEYVECRNADNTMRRRILRAGTYGRGVYECELGATSVPATGVSATRLMIRATAIDDTYSYIPRETVNYDPRLNVPGQPTQPFDLTRSVDIRIDPPPYQIFGDQLDAVEFDEDLRSDTLVLGETNFIYVQVHTRGHATLADVDVHLFFADAAGTPSVAPDLNAMFWNTYPNTPAASSPWKKAGTDRQSELHSGQPRVFRIAWTPPLDLGDNVALLAVAEHPTDTLIGLSAANRPTRSMNPALLPNMLAASEPRAALYITAARKLTPDVYVRGGLDDDGQPGAVAWGGRGADIIITDAAVADPAAMFTDITDTRADDRVRGGRDNHIYVRVFNGANAPQTIEVDVFVVPFATLTDSSTWQQIGATQTVVDVSAKGAAFTGGITWAQADITDPLPASQSKAYLVIALIASGEDIRPDPTGIATLTDFWAFFRSVEQANNASFRAVPYLPA